MPHRCIDGGVGVDGCRKREFFEVIGRDPTWRLAVQADVGGSFGLRNTIAHDAIARAVVREAAPLQVRAPLALPAPPPFDIADLMMDERTYNRDA